MRGVRKARVLETYVHRDGHELSWDQAMGLLRIRPADRAVHVEGRPLSGGTSGVSGSGVSWYEAAAYAEFAGKSLPASRNGFRQRRVRWPNTSSP